MKKLVYLFMSALVIAGVAACNQKDLEGLQSQIDSIKSGQIASISSQISSIQASISSMEKLDAELKARIDQLSGDNKEIAALKESLTQKEAALSKRIDELKAYVDEELKKQSDWAKATYSTLEQYQSTCNEIAAIKESLSTMESALRGLISDTETSIKSWVNEQLTGYYTIAQMDAKVAALEKAIANGDKAQADELNKLKANLETAKVDIKAAYENAITEAITTSEGKITKKIADDIKTATDALQSQIDAISTRLSALEGRVGNLETLTAALVSRIQSLSYIPRYTDGASTMWINPLADGTLVVRDTLDFRVSPADCVEDLVKVWQTALSVEAVSVVTRAGSNAVKVPIVSVSGANGKVSVELDGSALGDDYFGGKAPMMATLVVSDGNNERTSEYVGLVPAWQNAVDLGLSVLWARRNLGADTPEEYGDYYAWGEVEPYYSSKDPLTWKDGKEEGYDWPSYIWANGAQNKLTKYCLVAKTSFWDGTGDPDNKVVLEPEDDAAHVKLGYEWRMPTQHEWLELLDNCTYTWTTQNDVEGALLTGPSGNSIFLPAGGRLSYNNSISTGLVCYWSSSLSVDTPRSAWALLSSSGSDFNGYFNRCFGYSVRPVYGIVPALKVALNKTALSMGSGTTELLAATVVPSAQGLVWYSSNPLVATVTQEGLVTAMSDGEAKITVVSADGLQSASCNVTVEMSIPEAVDLGLSVKWASFNLGACAPEGYGLYYAWGETEPKENYSVSTYKWYNGSSNSIIKYNTVDSYGTVDNDDILDFDDDAAHVKLGGRWRMPSQTEWEELLYCSRQWTTLNGVNGYRITGNNGNSIFLPAAGRYNNYQVGTSGFYWSENLGSTRPNFAYQLYFYYYTIDSNYEWLRHYGCSVRPVWD